MEHLEAYHKQLDMEHKHLPMHEEWSISIVANDKKDGVPFVQFHPKGTVIGAYNDTGFELVMEPGLAYNQTTTEARMWVGQRYEWNRGKLSTYAREFKKAALKERKVMRRKAKKAEKRRKGYVLRGQQPEWLQGAAYPQHVARMRRKEIKRFKAKVEKRQMDRVLSAETELRDRMAKLKRIEAGRKKRAKARAQSNSKQTFLTGDKRSAAKAKNAMALLHKRVGAMSKTRKRKTRKARRNLILRANARGEVDMRGYLAQGRHAAAMKAIQRKWAKKHKR